jgi:hypothetical protein
LSRNIRVSKEVLVDVLKFRWDGTRTGPACTLEYDGVTGQYEEVGFKIESVETDGGF